MGEGEDYDVEQGSSGEMFDGEWHSGVFSCEDPGMCCCAIFCPCCWITKITEKVAPIEVGCCTIGHEMGCMIGILVFLLILGTYWPFLVFTTLFAMAVIHKYKIDEGLVM